MRNKGPATIKCQEHRTKNRCSTATNKIHSWGQVTSELKFPSSHNIFLIKLSIRSVWKSKFFLMKGMETLSKKLRTLHQGRELNQSGHSNWRLWWPIPHLSHSLPGCQDLPSSWTILDTIDKKKIAAQPHKAWHRKFIGNIPFDQLCLTKDCTPMRFQVTL